MSPARARPARGFTLVELFVAVAVNLIVLLGVMTLLQAQQRSFQRGSHDRALQDRARLAMSELTMMVRRAGYGIDPAFAFDLGAVANYAQILDRPDRARVGSASYACTAPVGCRDNKADGTDELVFYARDPYFTAQARPGGVSNAAIVLNQPLATALSAGQVLQVICQGGGWRAYVTVGSATAAGAPQIPLAAGLGTSFPQQTGLLANPDARCFNLAGTNVYKVDRFRFFIQQYADADGIQRPWLMLDNGLTDANGAASLVPVAPDIEDLQVAYVFPGAAANQVVGAAGGAIPAGAAGIDLAVVPPTYDDPATATSRQSHHPANIRSVRLSLVARAPIADNRGPVGANALLPAALNRAAVAAPAGYERFTLETSVAARNMESRGAVSNP